MYRGYVHVAKCSHVDSTQSTIMWPSLPFTSPKGEDLTMYKIQRSMAKMVVNDGAVV